MIQMSRSIMNGTGGRVSGVGMGQRQRVMMLALVILRGLRRRIVDMAQSRDMSSILMEDGRHYRRGVVWHRDEGGESESNEN